MNLTLRKKMETTQRGQSLSNVEPMRFAGDDEALLRALKMRHSGAAAVFYERYATHVTKVLVRILGMDRELSDLLNDVFYEAYNSVHSVKDPTRLKAWVTRIAVHVARACIRKRKQRRWLSFHSEMEGFNVPGYELADLETTQSVKAVQSVLNEMPTDERIVFALRFIEGMGLNELADACNVSLATIKRRIVKAEVRFKSLVEKSCVLKERLNRSPKWRKR